MSYTPSIIEEQAINLIKNEKNAWREGEVRLTEDISFNCRNIIKKARKNYFNIYDSPNDPVTGRRKLYVPLTRDMVETTVKNIDIDTKNIQVKAKNPDSYVIAGLAGMILRSKLDEIRFGQILNRAIRKCAVEGVAVLKHLKVGSNSTITIPENLNFYTDPTATYLNESAGNIEVNYLTVDEAKKYPWANLEYLVGQTSIIRTEDIPQVSTSIPYVEITERWGLMPRSFLTHDEADKNEYLEGVIIASNLSHGPIVHLIAENKTGQRPYVEFRTKMYDGRWLGLGIGEDLFDLQAYINEVFNVRLNTARIKQLGLFQIRKGSGITQSMLNQLHGAGAIQVSGIGKDIAELRTSDIKPSSYKDEDQAYQWAQRMTGAWEIGRGESLPASQPATTAVLQDRGMQTGFSLQQEELGFSISQFVETLFLPAILDNLTEKEIVRVTGDPKLLEDLDTAQTNDVINYEIVDYYKRNGYYPDKMNIEAMRNKAMVKLRKLGKDRFVKIRKTLFNPKAILDAVDIYVTEETVNKAVLAKQLNDILFTYSQISGLNIDTDLIMKEMFDLMGLSGERFIRRPDDTPVATPAVQGLPTMQEALAKSGVLRGRGVPKAAARGGAEGTAQATTMERTGKAGTPSL